MTPEKRARGTEMVERLAREITAQGIVSIESAREALAIEFGISHGCVVKIRSIAAQLEPIAS